MRIGMIAPPWFPLPPQRYGGIEFVVSLLTEGLVRRGHDVTLFASGDSDDAGAAELHLRARPLRADRERRPPRGDAQPRGLHAGAASSTSSTTTTASPAAPWARSSTGSSARRWWPRCTARRFTTEYGYQYGPGYGEPIETFVLPFDVYGKHDTRGWPDIGKPDVERNPPNRAIYIDCIKKVRDHFRSIISPIKLILQYT